MKIIFIGAIWCPSCLIMKSRIRKLMQAYPDVVLEEFDLDADARECERFAVGKILPLVLLASASGEITRSEGERSKQELIRMIEESRR